MFICFVMCRKSMTEYDPRIVAPTCLYLASKAEESTVQARLIVFYIKKMGMCLFLFNCSPVYAFLHLLLLLTYYLCERKLVEEIKMLYCFCGHLYWKFSMNWWKMSISGYGVVCYVQVHDKEGWNVNSITLLYIV